MYRHYFSMIRCGSQDIQCIGITSLKAAPQRFDIMLYTRVRLGL